MKIEVITVVYNEEFLLPFFLRHYNFADKITVFYDEASTDKTLKILQSNSKVKIYPFRFLNGLNETEKIYMINKAYRKSRAKYCIIVDCDEFVFMPKYLWRNIYFCRLYQAMNIELNKNKTIKEQCNNGYLDPLYLKPSVIKTRKRFKLKEGHHEVTRYYIKIRPFINIINGVHLNMMNWKFYKNRMLKDRIPRQSDYNIKKGFSRQFTNLSIEALRVHYNECLLKCHKLW